MANTIGNELSISNKRVDEVAKKIDGFIRKCENKYDFGDSGK
jgi:hypothetical protein